MSEDAAEFAACIPQPIRLDDFNPQANLPYGCTVEALYGAMHDFIEFLGFINQQLVSRSFMRLEKLLMPANFSSMVGEFVAGSIPKHTPTLVRNQYHNGYPDLLPAGRFPNDAVKYTREGMEIKASRYLSGWQGHNAEEGWLVVVTFESSRPSDASKGLPARPFRFVQSRCRPAEKNRLDVFGAFRNQPTNHYRQRQSKRLPEDGEQLDLPCAELTIAVLA